MKVTTLLQTYRNTLLIAVTVILLVVLCLTLLKQPIISQMNRWKLLPEPEKLTELYFTQPNSLPSTYIPGQTQQVNFTVHNLEYQTEDYRYQIIEQSQDGSQSQVLTSNTFTLHQNQYQAVSFTGPLADVGPDARVVINFPTVHESIDYLITRRAQ